MKLPQQLKSGFTLVEMTVVIVFGMALSAAGLMLLNQQIQTVRTFNDQDFILSEAPQINTSLASLLGKADAIRLHSNFAGAVGNTSPVLSGATTLVAAYRNVDNTTSFGIICFETVSGQQRLNYYYYDPTPPATAPTQGNPSWTISRNISNVNFSLVDGLFKSTLSGPNGEQITYTISPNQ
ncbi:MAG: PulJ/GspJ family protein [Roseibacillus sp.]